MNKNLITIVAEELGVEIGEEFEVEDAGQYRFTETRLEYKQSDGSYSPAILPFNFLNERQIIRSPFEPKLGQSYWTYSADWTPDWEMHWCDASWEHMALKAGCVFRTEEEALAARPAKYKELTGKDWKE